MNNNTKVCTKKSWNTIDEANKACESLNSKKSSIDRGLKMRVYKCQKCDLFHLSSLSIKTYNKREKCRTDKRYRQKNRHQSFIQTEALHWNAKFGIEE